MLSANTIWQFSKQAAQTNADLMCVLYTAHSISFAAGHYITEDVSPAYLQSLESSIRTQDKSLPGQQAVMVA